MSEWGLKLRDYLGNSLNYALFGDYGGEPTLLGHLGQVLLGTESYHDFESLLNSLVNFKFDWKSMANVSINLIATVDITGIIKSGDDYLVIAKNGPSGGIKLDDGSTAYKVGIKEVSGIVESAISKGTEKTWREFWSVNTGRSIEEAVSSYKKLIDGESPWPEGFVPRERVLKAGDTFQMCLDKTQAITSPGNFATFDNITSVDYVRNKLAVKSDWKTDCSKVVTYRVKEGMEISVLEGPVGPQIDIKADKYLSGGGTQIQMLLDRNVNKMDYLEVVSERSIS